MQQPQCLVDSTSISFTASLPRCTYMMSVMSHACSQAEAKDLLYPAAAAQVTIACNGLIETIGRVLDGEVKHPIIAHPKKCPETGTWSLVCPVHSLHLKIASMS